MERAGAGRSGADKPRIRRAKVDANACGSADPAVAETAPVRVHDYHTIPSIRLAALLHPLDRWFLDPVRVFVFVVFVIVVLVLVVFFAGWCRGNGTRGFGNRAP